VLCASLGVCVCVCVCGLADVHIIYLGFLTGVRWHSRVHSDSNSPSENCGIHRVEVSCGKKSLDSAYQHPYTLYQWHTIRDMTMRNRPLRPTGSMPIQREETASAGMTLRDSSRSSRWRKTS
jgi:hypothetical protein